MSEAARPSLMPIALGNDEGEAFWFFGALVTIKASSKTTGGRVAVIEHLVSQGSARFALPYSSGRWSSASRSAGACGGTLGNGCPGPLQS
jgi:hypothetical protein